MGANSWSIGQYFLFTDLTIQTSISSFLLALPPFFALFFASAVLIPAPLLFPRGLKGLELASLGIPSDSELMGEYARIAGLSGHLLLLNPS